MEKDKLSRDSVGQLKEVIDKCEYSRYSPDSDVIAADDTYRKAENVIKAIENK